MTAITKDAARKTFADCGLTYNDVNKQTLRVLQGMIQTRICEYSAVNAVTTPSMTVSKRVVLRSSSATGDFSAFLFVNAHYFKHRELVSFNDDGFIGLCGWADGKNEAPIIRGFVDWCRWLGGLKKLRETVSDADAHKIGGTDE